MERKPRARGEAFVASSVEQAQAIIALQLS
jgi:hypothetical protein